MPDKAAANAARKKPPRRQSAVAAISRSSSVDRALIGCGVLIALCSLSFAGYMVADVGQAPRIAGMEYLCNLRATEQLLLAAGNRTAAGRRRRCASRSDADRFDRPKPRRRPARLRRRRRPGARIDPTPTGSIPDKSAAGRPVNLILTPMRAFEPSPPPSPYKLLDVLNGEALLQTDVGLRHVKAGDLLPDLGRINSIERRGDHWVLLTQSGTALEWPPPAAAPAAIAGPRRPPKKTIR